MNSSPRSAAARVLPMNVMPQTDHLPTKDPSDRTWSMEAVRGYRPNLYDEIFVRHVCLRLFLTGRADLDPRVFVYENHVLPGAQATGR